METELNDNDWQVAKEILSKVCRNPDVSPHPALLKDLCKIAYSRARLLNRNTKRKKLQPGIGRLTDKGIVLMNSLGEEEIVLSAVDHDTVLTKKKIIEQDSAIAMDDWSISVKVIRAICFNPIISTQVDSVKGEISKIAKSTQKAYRIKNPIVQVKEIKPFFEPPAKKSPKEDYKTLYLDDMPDHLKESLEQNTELPKSSISKKPKSFWSRLFGG